MPGTPTTKWSLPTMSGSDLINQVDEWTVAFGAAVDPLLAPSDQGLFANRPVSTGGSPGKIGRTYKSTDGNGGESFSRLFRDNGTGWDEIVLVAPTTQTWLTSGMVPDAASNTIQYYKDSLGIVHLRHRNWSPNGGVQEVAGFSLGTLPAGYRPAANYTPATATPAGAWGTVTRVDAVTGTSAGAGRWLLAIDVSGTIKLVNQITSGALWWVEATFRAEN